MKVAPPVLLSNDADQRVLAFCFEEEYEKTGATQNLSRPLIIQEKR